MGVKQNAKRQKPRVKSRPASFAAPRQDAPNAEEIVSHRPALGTPAARTMARRAVNRGGPDRLSPRQQEAKSSGIRKRQRRACLLPAPAQQSAFLSRRPWPDPS